MIPRQVRAHTYNGKKMFKNDLPKVNSWKGWEAPTRCQNCDADRFKKTTVHRNRRKNQFYSMGEGSGKMRARPRKKAGAKSRGGVSQDQPPGKMGPKGSYGQRLRVRHNRLRETSEFRGRTENKPLHNGVQTTGPRSKNEERQSREGDSD